MLWCVVCSLYGLKSGGCRTNLDPIIQQVHVLAADPMVTVHRPSTLLHSKSVVLYIYVLSPLHVLRGGKLHLNVVLMMEMRALPVAWEAKVRCVQFWYKVSTGRVYEVKLLKKVSSQAVECVIRVSWISCISMCVNILCVGRYG